MRPLQRWKQALGEISLRPGQRAPSQRLPITGRQMSTLLTAASDFLGSQQAPFKAVPSAPDTIYKAMHSVYGYVMSGDELRHCFFKNAR